MTPATTSMREYAVAKTCALLEDVVAAMHHAAKKPDESAVHKMRVSIRRLQQAVRLFQQYLEPDGVKHVKARTRAIMEVAGELRNRDIATGLVTEAGGDVAELTKERLQFQAQLEHLLKDYAKPDLSTAWRSRLGLDKV